MKSKYIVLCLEALGKSQNARKAFRHAALMGNYQLLVICLGPINPLNGLLSVRSRWCARHEILWPREGFKPTTSRLNG